MAKHFLKDGAIFQCSMGMLSFVAKQNGGKTTHGTGNVLTDKAELKPPPAPCPVLTAAYKKPTICKGSFTNWQMADTHVTSEGHPLLTNDSFKMCKQDPLTRAAKLSCLTSINNATTATKSASVVSIAALTLQKPVALASPAVAAKPSPSGVAAASAAQAANAEKSEAATKPADAAKLAGTKETDAITFDPNDDKELFCEASTCPPEKKARCPYYNASAVAEKSDSQKLRANYVRLLKAGEIAGDASDINYQAFLTDSWIANRYDEGADVDFVWDDVDEVPNAEVQHALTDERIQRAIENMIFQSWTYAAHHLISTNQIFATLPRLVKLANAYKEPVEGEDAASSEAFDINGGWNCIMLPSMHRWDEDEEENPALTKEQNEKEKKARHNASAFDVMSLIGLQWHVGPHGRVFDAEEEAQARRQMGFMEHRPRALKSYAASVIAELQKLEKTMLDEKNKTCRNTIEQKQAFLHWMQRLARKLKRQLSKFHEDPKASYPFYVSIEAYKFAFSIPITTKVAVLSMDGTKEVCCQTFRAEHRGKSANDVELQFKETGEALCAPWPLSDNGKRKIIERLENIQYFALADGLKNEAFAFLCVDGVDTEHFYAIKNRETEETAQDMLDDNMSQIAIWLRDVRMNEGPYVSKLRMIRHRLAKLELQASEGM